MRKRAGRNDVKGGDSEMRIGVGSKGERLARRLKQAELETGR